MAENKTFCRMVLPGKRTKGPVSGTALTAMRRFEQKPGAAGGGFTWRRGYHSRPSALGAAWGPPTRGTWGLSDGALLDCGLTKNHIIGEM